jgi:hypothetical protein
VKLGAMRAGIAATIYNNTGIPHIAAHHTAIPLRDFLTNKSSAGAMRT